MERDDPLVRHTLQWATNRLTLVIAELEVMAALVQAPCTEDEAGTSLTALAASLETACCRLQRLLSAPHAGIPV